MDDLDLLARAHDAYVQAYREGFTETARAIASISDAIENDMMRRSASVSLEELLNKNMSHTDRL